MFERYTERARRSLFFARFAVTEFGGEVIEVSHLLMGLVRCDRGWWGELLAPAHDVAAIEVRLGEIQPGGTKVSTSVEIPFSGAVKDILKGSAAEADARGSRDVRPIHMLLALIAHAEGEAVCRKAGIDVHAVRAAAPSGSVVRPVA